jgi:hypothetical protein
MTVTEAVPDRKLPREPLRKPEKKILKKKTFFVILLWAKI